MSVVISSVPAQGNDEWRRRCFRITIDAILGEDQDICQSYERVRYINGEPLLREIDPNNSVHKLSDIVGVVCPSGRTLGMAIEDILWCNDHMDEVDTQIANSNIK